MGVEVDFEVDFEVDVEVLRLDDDSEVLLRLDDRDVLGAVEVAVEVVDVVNVVIVVKGIDEVPEPGCDDCEMADVVCFEFELLPVLTVPAPVRVDLAVADESARGAD